MSIERAFCNQRGNLNLVSFIVHSRFTCAPFWFLNASADIDTQVEQSEQGTVSVETTFCNQCILNLVSFIVHSWFTCVLFWFLDTSDTQIQQSEQRTVSIEIAFCNAT